MKLLLVALSVLAGAVALALWARHEPGYLLLAYGQWRVETTLAFAVVATLLAFVLFYLGVRLLAGGARLPERLGVWAGERRARKARRDTQRGLLALAEGRWSTAEELLAGSAPHSDTPLLNYLGAARAAQKAGSEQRRDRYLSCAARSMPEAELAVGLTQAETLLSQGQAERGLATLMHLRQLAPRHPYVLHLLGRVYQRLGSWEELRDLLPELRRHKVLTPAQAELLEKRAHGKLLERAVERAEVAELHRVWAHMPKPLQADPELAGAYAKALAGAGRGAEAAELVAGVLDKAWDPRLIAIYGLVEAPEPERRLARAEQWLKQRERNPDLLLAAGRLALRARLWGKARAYLEASLGVDPRPETCCELALLLSGLGEEAAAVEHYRRGLQLAVGAGCTAAGLRIDRRTPPALAADAEAPRADVTVV